MTISIRVLTLATTIAFLLLIPETMLIMNSGI
jgi:hypothetical protein